MELRAAGEATCLQVWGRQAIVLGQAALPVLVQVWRNVTPARMGLVLDLRQLPRIADVQDALKQLQWGVANIACTTPRIKKHPCPTPTSSVVQQP